MFAVLLGALGVVVVAVAGGGGSEDRSLGLERYRDPQTNASELLASVPAELNKPQTARDGASVGFQCRDGRGRLVLSGRHSWPFVKEEGFPRPHAHQPASERQLTRISSCRLTGTTVELEGELRLR